jgi:hypothetical protein
MRGEMGCGSGWALAEKGVAVRRVDASARGKGQIPEPGERLPEELALHAEWTADDEDAEWEDTTPYLAPDLALRLGTTSLSPWAPLLGKIPAATAGGSEGCVGRPDALLAALSSDPPSG